MSKTLTKPGFYRITLDGYRGVGACRHETHVGTREPYERWWIMFLAKDLTGESARFTTAYRETDAEYPGFIVGKRIPGLAPPAGPM